MKFQEFPRAYRWSQTGIGFTLVALAVGGPLFRIVPDELRVLMLSALGAIVLGSLLITNYVLIRYPFISLVEAADGDYFSKHFASSDSLIYPLLKWVGLLLSLVMAGGSLLVLSRGVGPVPPAFVGVLIYATLLSGFFFFLIFFYDPIRHPTVATFIRCTLGLGILLFPLFAITLLIGSLRCRRQLAQQAG